MCLIVSVKHPFRMIATENMVVYKVINVDNKSSMMGFHYTENKGYMCSFGINKEVSDGVGYVREGFHSWWDPMVAEFNCSRIPDPVYGVLGPTKLVKFIVPKGAHYYLGNNRDMVSDMIVSGDLGSIHFGWIMYELWKIRMFVHRCLTRDKQ